MNPIDVYGPYPQHLDSEKYAVQNSSLFFENIGTLCLKTQIDGYDDFTITNISNGWITIKIKNQLEYIDKIYQPLIGIIREEDLDKYHRNTNLEKSSNLLEISNNFLNTPYKWGAKSKISTDCSGLVYQIYRQYGIILPRYSDGQFYKTKEINPKDIRTGDLIFVVINKPVHVLMYLENSLMIESCGLPNIYTTRTVSFKDKWGYNIDDLYNGIKVINGSLYFHRAIA